MRMIQCIKFYKCKDDLIENITILYPLQEEFVDQRRLTFLSANVFHAQPRRPLQKFLRVIPLTRHDTRQAEVCML